jgi:mRNA interferase MazF
MTVFRGDVVILDAPFISRPGGKVRPMLVVQNNRNNGRMANTILAVITTNTSRSSEPTQVLIDPKTEPGRSSGSVSLSVVSCENLVTAQQNAIVRKIGRLSDEQMQSVNAALKVSLELL